MPMSWVTPWTCRTCHNAGWTKPFPPHIVPTYRQDLCPGIGLPFSNRTSSGVIGVRSETIMMASSCRCDRSFGTGANGRLDNVETLVSSFLMLHDEWVDRRRHTGVKKGAGTALAKPAKTAKTAKKCLFYGSLTPARHRGRHGDAM